LLVCRGGLDTNEKLIPFVWSVGFGHAHVIKYGGWIIRSYVGMQLSRHEVSSLSIWWTTNLFSTIIIASYGWSTVAK
jgi:hypothetical protein